MMVLRLLLVDFMQLMTSVVIYKEVVRVHDPLTLLLKRYVQKVELPLQIMVGISEVFDVENRFECCTVVCGIVKC